MGTSGEFLCTPSDSSQLITRLSGQMVNRIWLSLIVFSSFSGRERGAENKIEEEDTVERNSV